MILLCNLQRANALSNLIPEASNRQFAITQSQQELRVYHGSVRSALRSIFSGQETGMKQMAMPLKRYSIGQPRQSRDIQTFRGSAAP